MQLPGPRRVASIKEIASIAGVSIATVSNTLNGKGRISEEVRKRVLEICRQHNYTPNSAGRNLRRQLNEAIGLIFYPSCAAVFRNIFYAEILGSLSGAIEEAHHDLVLSGSEGETLTARPPRFVAQRRVDGVILLGQFPRNVVRTIHDYGLPLVLIDNHRPSVPVDSVTTDGFGATRAIVDHLVGLGHRRIGFMAYQQDGYNAARRESGFNDGVRHHGLPPSLCPVLRDFTETTGAWESLAKVLGRQRRPTAVITVNDTLAVEMLARLRNDGYEVPRDISIFGFDDDAISRTSLPPLATVRVDKTALGCAGAEMILARLQDPQRPVAQRIVPVELVARESVGPPPSD